MGKSIFEIGMESEGLEVKRGAFGTRFVGEIPPMPVAGGAGEVMPVVEDFCCSDVVPSRSFRECGVGEGDICADERRMMVRQEVRVRVQAWVDRMGISVTAMEDMGLRELKVVRGQALVDELEGAGGCLCLGVMGDRYLVGVTG